MSRPDARGFAGNAPQGSFVRIRGDDGYRDQVEVYTTATQRRRSVTASARPAQKIYPQEDHPFLEKDDDPMRPGAP